MISPRHEGIGDVVKCSFRLGVLFQKGEQFCLQSALLVSLLFQLSQKLSSLIGHKLIPCFLLRFTFLFSFRVFCFSLIFSFLAFVQLLLHLLDHHT